MGIDGLLQLLKPITHKQHISTFAKQKIGIDVSPWLYKGCYNHAMQLSKQEIGGCLSNIELSPCAYILQMIELFQYYQISPLFVLDGLSLPMKKQTIHKRQEMKGSLLEKLSQLTKKQMDDENRTQSVRKCFASSIRISQKMINDVLSVLKFKKKQFIVAPFQSDSQLAKLKQLGIVDSIITEDSDLLVYGSNVIYKLNQDGQCDYIDFSLVQESQVLPRYVSCFLKMSWEERISCCVLAGCDYVVSIKGIGIKKAIKIISECSSLQNFIERAKSDNSLSNKVSQEYSTKILNAKNIFKHALTFDPLKQTLQPFTEPEMLDESVDLEKFSEIIGKKYEEYLDMRIYNGQFSAKTLSRRQFTRIQMPASQEINLIKLKDLENLYTKKKKSIENMKEKKQQILEGNMIEAMSDLRESRERWMEKERMRMMTEEVMRVVMWMMRECDIRVEL